MTPDAITTYSFFHELQKNGGEIYLVGGCVRDTLLSKKVKDLDLVVRNITIDSLIPMLKKHGRTDLVGKAFGIVKFHPKENTSLEIDIALPRTEVSTGTGHRDFNVHFSPDLPIEKDLGRRDFTVNAIAHNLVTDEIIDPYNGREDLNAKLIRCVFDNAFKEDPLRLLRAVQFAARLGFRIEDATFRSMRDNAPLIKTVARERIATEIAKLLTAPIPSRGFDLLRDTGLLQFVFPDVSNMIGVTQPQKNNEDVYTHTMKVLDAARAATELEKPGDLNIMFSALFHDAGKPKTRREAEDDAKRVTFFNHQIVSTGIAWRWMKDFKISTTGADPKHICHLVRNHMFETKEFHNERALRRFIGKVGKDNIMDLLDLRLADKKGGRFPNKVYGILQLREKIKAELAKKPPFTPKDLALNGHDFMNMGFKAGPVIGKIQKYLMALVIDDPELNTRDALTKLIEEKRDLIESGGNLPLPEEDQNESEISSSDEK